MNFKLVVFFLLAGFILMMSTLVYKSLETDFYLVSDDYYMEGVYHNDKQAKLDNVAALENKVIIKTIEDKLFIQLPTEVDSGSVLLFRPSNGKKDIRLKILPNQRIISYQKDRLDKGKWITKLNWSYNGKHFYSENNIYIQ